MNTPQKTVGIKVASTANPRPTFVQTMKIMSGMPKAFAKAMVGRDEFTKQVDREALASKRAKGKGTSGSW